MLKMKWATVVLVLALLSISCRLFTSTGSQDGVVSGDATSAPTSNQDGVVAGDAKRVFAEQPVFDLQAPLPSPGAAALRVLSGWDPSVAELEGGVEAAERAAMTAFIKELTAQTGSRIEPALPTVRISNSRDANPAPAALIQVSYHYAPNFQDGSTDTVHDASLAAGLVSGLSDIISDQMPAGSNISPSQTSKEGDATVTMTGDVGKSTDGSSKFGIGIKTETVKDGSTTSTDFQAYVDGQRCPNSEGQVSFTTKVRLGASSGNNGITQDLTAFVRVVVDDNTQIASTTIDVIQGTQQIKNGRMVYVESGQTIKYNGNDMATLQISNLRLIQQTDNATSGETGELSGNGHDSAFAMGRTALLTARNKWLDGGCVKIEAASPAKVAPGSTTPIAVTVLHKLDGSTVPSKLEAVLSGETSLVPTSLPKTPGTLTYTAPGEKGKSATIKLTATSRRGIATLDLTANTGGQSFTLDVVSEGAHFSGTICSLDQPFVIRLDAGEVFDEVATPSSSTGGQMSGGLSVEGCTFDYKGPYTIRKNEDGSATMQWTNSWSADCPGLGSKSGVTNHELPLQPAPENACQ